MKDALLKVTKALPAAAATNNTDAVDLEITGGVERSARAPIKIVKVTVPALPNNTDSTKTILLDLHDSADGSAFAEASPLIECKIPGVAATGSLEKTFSFPLPSSTRRYIRFKQTVPTGAGDNTAGSVTYELDF